MADQVVRVTLELGLPDTMEEPAVTVVAAMFADSAETFEGCVIRRLDIELDEP